MKINASRFVSVDSEFFDTITNSTNWRYEVTVLLLIPPANVPSLSWSEKMASLHTPTTSTSIPLQCQPPHHSLLESLYWYCFIYGWVCCCSLASLAFCCVPHCSKFVATMASWRICLIGLMFSLLAEIGSKTGPLTLTSFAFSNTISQLRYVYSFSCLFQFIFRALQRILFYNLAFQSITHLKIKKPLINFVPSFKKNKEKKTLS